MYRIDECRAYVRTATQQNETILSILKILLSGPAEFDDEQRYAAPRRRTRVGSRTMPTSESRSCRAASWPSRRIIPPMNTQTIQKHTPSAVGIRAKGMEISSQSRVAR